MAKKPQKKKRPSWFQKQIERDGEDFLLRKQPLDIQREAFNIVRDIARGNITQRDFKYLFTPTILANIHNAFNEKYIEYHTYYSTMTLSMNVPNGVQVLEQSYGVATHTLQKYYNNVQTILTTYSVVLQSITTMISAVQSNYLSDEARHQCYIQVYNSIQYQLSRFRHNI